MKKQLQIIGLSVLLMLAAVVFFTITACVSYWIIETGLKYLLIIIPIIFFGWIAYGLAKDIIQSQHEND